MSPGTKAKREVLVMLAVLSVFQMQALSLWPSGTALRCILTSARQHRLIAEPGKTSVFQQSLKLFLEVSSTVGCLYMAVVLGQL